MRAAPPLRVVIVDDDTVRGLARLCGGLGWHVAGTAHDPAAAVREHRPDVVIIDLDLRSARSGIDLAADLVDSTPIVLVTCTEEPPIGALVERDGVYGFLVKPVTRTALRTTVELVVMQHAARTRLRDREHHYRHLLAESQRIAAIGSFHFDYASGAVAWTDETYRLHGTSPETFTPSRDTIVPLIAAEHRALLEECMSRSDAFRGEVEYAVDLPDGTTRTLRATAELVRDSDGAPSAAVGTVQDITERERARVAVEASRAKTEFLAHMSHELRTPLNAVLGLSEALVEGTFGGLSEAQAATLSTIHASGRHLLDLINDVLDLARVESGKLTLEVESVHVRPLIDESTALVYRQIALKGQRLVLDLPAALPPIEIDRRRIKQVLLNLLGNSCKFSPPGATITVRATCDDELSRVALAVADDGPGIAPEDHARIFEPFVTLDPSISRTHGGAGLGLTLAKRIVDLHGGAIEVAGRPGRGTTFTMALPVSTTYVADVPLQRGGAEEHR